MKQRKKNRKSKELKSPSELIALQNGELALKAGQFSRAVDYFATIPCDSTNYGRACKGRGAALLRMQRVSEAFPFLKIAHESFPQDPQILVDGGDIARLTGNLDAAEETYAEARKLGADGFQIKFGEAVISLERKRWLEAVSLWTDLNNDYPGDAIVLHNLGRAYHELGETDKAVSLMSKAVQVGGKAVSLPMLALLAPHAGACDHEEVKRLRVSLSEQLKVKEGNPGDSARRTKKNGRINIGYVSAFFHRRNWMKPVWALLNNQNREQFNIHLFADAPLDEINTTGGYVSHDQDKIYDTRKLSNRELAKLIGECEIDVLVDLNSYSAMNRLGLWTSKPAPVTIGWFNLYATSGMPGIEWLIGDDVVIYPEEEKFYTEKILRLNQSYLTFQVGYNTPDIEIPADEEPFTFGCLGSGYKITPEVRAAWIEILNRTNETRLIVRNQILAEESHKKWFLDFFREAGISPERIVLLGPAEHHEFLQTYGKIDLALDTFPYNGGTTTMEALWQGVPVICFKGDRWVSRTSATLLNSANLNDFIGENEREYIDLAIQWSAPGRKIKLRKLRTEMRKRLERSDVCGGTGLAKDFEKLIFEILESTNNFS